MAKLILLLIPRWLHEFLYGNDVPYIDDSWKYYVAFAGLILFIIFTQVKKKHYVTTVGNTVITWHFPNETILEKTKSLLLETEEIETKLKEIYSSNPASDPTKIGLGLNIVITDIQRDRVSPSSVTVIGS